MMIISISMTNANTLKHSLYSLALLSLLVAQQCKTINLENRAQDFVLDVKQIVLPDYPHAFNPSIVEWRGALLMSFRVIPDPKHSFNSWLGLTWLNEDFEPVGMPQKLRTRPENARIPSRAEDGRLIIVNDKLYMVYSDNEDPVISKGGFRVYIAEIDIHRGRFYIKRSARINHIERLSSFPGNNSNRREKNWTPFAYRNSLLLAYSLTPHIILKTSFGTNSATQTALSNSLISWDWGELRGGTTGLLDGNQYLSFFHSAQRMATVHSQNKEVLHYLMGAYTFAAQPPFNITQISPEPIIGKKFYSGAEYKPYWHPVRAIFPCGFVFDKQYIWVVYGRQDHEMWVVKLDKLKLYASLIPAPIQKRGG